MNLLSPSVLGVLSGVVREFGQCEADFFLFVLSPLILSHASWKAHGLGITLKVVCS